MEIPSSYESENLSCRRSGVIGRRLGPLLVEADYEVFGTTAVKLRDSQMRLWIRSPRRRAFIRIGSTPIWLTTSIRKYLARIEPSLSDRHASCEGFSIIGIEGIFNRCCQGVCRKWNGMYESSCVVPLKLFGRSYFCWLATILVAHVRTPFAN